MCYVTSGSFRQQQYIYQATFHHVLCFPLLPGSCGDEVEWWRCSPGEEVGFGWRDCHTKRGDCATTSINKSVSHPRKQSFFLTHAHLTPTRWSNIIFKLIPQKFSIFQRRITPYPPFWHPLNPCKQCLSNTFLKSPGGFADVQINFVIKFHEAPEEIHRVQQSTTYLFCPSLSWWMACWGNLWHLVETMRKKILISTKGYSP